MYQKISANPSSKTKKPVLSINSVAEEEIVKHNSEEGYQNVMTVACSGFDPPTRLHDSL